MYCKTPVIAGVFYLIGKINYLSFLKHDDEPNISRPFNFIHNDDRL